MENNNMLKCCSTCGIEKNYEKFNKNKNKCKDCNNEMRRFKYNNDEELRKKIIIKSGEYKIKKSLIKTEIKLQNNIDIGEENKQCKTCEKILNKTNFRHNRLTCIECEKNYGREYRKSDIGKEKSNEWVENNREKMTALQSNWYQNNKSHIREKDNIRLKTDFCYKFIKTQRRRILLALKQKNMRTIEYLGCNAEEYLQWISSQLNDEFTLENHGLKWHIDHVIPLSKFNLDDENEVLLSLNWRNTTPLSIKDNLTKNNKIIPEQVEQHFKKLEEYHIEKNIKMPQLFIDLYAKHLVDGKSSKPILQLTFGNLCKDLD